MKALEKDRTRRYETANGFAGDIQRYLDGDPVEACPPSAAYKLKKLARKHRAALATITAFALLLVTATVVSAGLAVWANRERIRAVKAEFAAIEQKSAPKSASRRRSMPVKRFADVVRETPELKNSPALAPLRAKLLKEPQAFFKKLRDRLQADKATTPESRSRLASASFDLGKLTVEIGDKQDALRSFEQSLAIFERLCDNPSVTQFRIDLAKTHYYIGNTLGETGRTSGALISHEQALTIYEQLVRENPTVAEFRNGLARSHFCIGILHQESGRIADALLANEQARTIIEQLVFENPTDSGFRSNLAHNYFAAGNLQYSAGQVVQALASFNQARTRLEQVQRENPAVSDFALGLARTLQQIGITQLRLGRAEEALASQAQARTILERLADENPAFTRFKFHLANVLIDFGNAQRVMGRTDEALASFEQGRTISKRVTRENPADPTHWDILATCQSDMGVLLNEKGRTAEALVAQEQARAIRERLVREHPESPRFASQLGASLNNLATIDLSRQQFEAGYAKLTKATEWQRKALAAKPRDPEYRQGLAKILANLMKAANGFGRSDEAARAQRELEALRDSEPQIVALDTRLLDVLNGKETPENEAERLQLAYRAYEKSLHAASARLFTEALANDPKLADDRQSQHRYNAACAAALAGCGQGKDEPAPGKDEKTKLRRQAREWLRAELAAWRRILDSGTPDMKAKVAPALQHWKADTDLAGIRDEKALAKLPETDRNDSRALWSAVDDLLRKATGSSTPARGEGTLRHRDKHRRFAILEIPCQNHRIRPRYAPDSGTILGELI